MQQLVKTSLNAWVARSLHHIPILDLKNIIFTVVYLQKGGSNWGIKTVQTTIWLIPLRVPRLIMKDALHELQPKK
jgi:hypothetical protein